jgi:hypothetical protein
LKATIKVQLPIPELSSKARAAIVVPGLKRNLDSVSKFSDAGYTTVFHPGEEGVTIHAPNTFHITTTTQPILLLIEEDFTVWRDSERCSSVLLGIYLGESLGESC